MTYKNYVIKTLATVLRGEGFKVVVQQENTSINSSTNNVTNQNSNLPTQNGNSVNSNQPRKNKKKNKKNRNQHRQVLHQPFPVMPFVTYSKIETTPPTQSRYLPRPH